MRAFPVIILNALIATAHAKEAALKQNGNSQNLMDKLVDKFIDKLMDHVINLPIDHADLDDTTLALAQPMTSAFQSIMAPRVAPMTSRTVTLFNDIPNFALPSAGQRPQVRMDAMRGSSMMSVPSLSAAPMATSHVPLQGMSVPEMQKTLMMYGVPPSPLQKLALTQLVSTRDPSMKAQVREVFSSLDPATQAKIRKGSEEIIARAAELAPGEIDVKLENMAGITQPLGLWDPASLAKDIPRGRLYFYREAELKNGRVAMLAFLGCIVTQGFRPFMSGGTPWVSAVQSHFADAGVNDKFWPALFFAAGIAELFSYPDRTKIPGDLGFDPLGLKPKTEKDFVEMQNKEINNGRLAMMAMAGIYGQELIAGKHVF